MKKVFHFLPLLLFVTAIIAQQPKLMLPIGHTSIVISASFSPNGKFIVTASQDGTLKQWDAISGQPVVQDFEGTPTGTFLWASYSPACPDDPTGGKYIVATSASDIAAGVWDATSGKLVLNLQGHTDLVLIARFSPDGKNIVTASYDNTAKVWDTKNGKLVLNLQGHASGILDALYSPDGKYIVTRSWDSTAKVWDAASGLLVATLKDKYLFYNVSFSPNGKYIVTASKDSTAKVWDAHSGTIAVTLKGHSNIVRNAIYSPDGESVLTSSNDNTAKIWDARSGKLFLTLKGHSGTVRNALFSPDGKYILTSSTDSTEKVWDARSGELVSDIKENGKLISNLLGFIINASFSPNGKSIITFGTSEIAKVWNTLNAQFIVGLKGHTDYVNNISPSPNGNYIATASGDSTAKIWDIINGKPFITLKHMSRVSDVSYSPNGKNIVTASWDSTAKVWDASTGNLLADLKGHTNQVRSASYSPDGNLILTYSLDKTAKIWDAVSGLMIATIKHTNHLSEATFSPNGKYILTRSGDSTAKIWDATNGLLIATTKRTGLISDVSFSPDGKYIVTCSLDSLNAKIWDALNGQLVATIKHKSIVYNSSFSPDGKYLLTVHEDSTPILWNTISWQKVAVLKGQTGKVFYATFSPDGKHIISRSGENSVIFWETDSWNIIKKIDCYRCYYSDFKNKRFLNSISAKVSIHDMETGNKLYTFLTVDSTDYLVYDKYNRYDGTPAARKMLYFTCGREIIELNQVKDQLWVPNLAERIMKGDSINAKTLDELNICGLTPEVEDSSYKADEYHFKIFPRRGGLGETVLYLNGIEIKKYKPTELKNNGGTYELRLKKAALKDLFVAGKENRLTVKAFTSDNAISSRALNISEDKSKDKATAPNLFAVMVGVSDYKGDELDLKYPGKDATDIAAVVSNAAKNLLNTDGAEHVFMYNLTTDKDHYQLPEKKSIKKVLEEIGTKATANDILLIFFAGHGVMRGAEDNKQFYFLTADASYNSSYGAVADVGISTSELTEWIKPANIKAQKRIMIFDACNSGQAIKDFVKLGNKDQGYIAARSDEKGQEIKAIEKLNNQSGLFILSASASNLAAYEMGRYSQGLLTYSLLKAIKQQPGILNEGKYLDLSKWFNAARETVSELSKETGARQDPQIVSNTNFNIGVVDEDVMAKIVLQNEKPLFAACNFQNADENNPVDNLGLNKLIDQQLNSISSRGTDAPIVYAGITPSAEAYTLSGRYNITGNSITIKVFIIQNKEVKQKIDISGTKDKLDEFTALIATRAVEWASKK